MPTNAEQQYQQDLMRVAIQRAALAQQAGAANAAAKAAMYSADRGLDATKYTADTGLTGIKDTNQTNLAGETMRQGGMTDRTDMEQRGATERAGIMTRPQMAEAALRQRQYQDERGDKTNSQAYLESQIAADALREAFPSLRAKTGGTAQVDPIDLDDAGGVPKSGDSDRHPAIGGGVPAAAPGENVKPKPSGAPVAAPQGKPYDMKGFNAGVQDIASKLPGYKESDWTPGASVNGVQIAAPPTAPEPVNPLIADNLRKAAEVKAAMLADIPGASKFATTATHEAPGTVTAQVQAAAPASNPLRDRVLERAGLGDPTAIADRQLRLALQQKLADAAANGDAGAQDALRAKGIDIPQGAFSNPSLDQKKRADAEATTTTGLTALVEPDVQELEKAIASPNFWVSAKDRTAIINQFNAIMTKAKAAGFDDRAIQGLRSQLHGRLNRAMAQSGAPFFGDKTYSELEPTVSGLFLQ